MYSKNKILFVHPCLEANRKFKIRAKREHLGIGYLLSILRKNDFDAQIIDADILDLNAIELAHRIRRIEPFILGIAVSSQLAMRETIELVKFLRKSNFNSHITIGGHFPTFEHFKILLNVKEIDSVIRGEAEGIIVEFCRRLITGESLNNLGGVSFRQNGEIIINRDFPNQQNIDSFPLPARDTLEEILKLGQPASILASRGCYGSCKFCTQNAFYRLIGWRPRNPALVIKEIFDLYQTFNVRYFRFYDDNFVGPGKKGKMHVVNLCNEILKYGIDIKFEIYCRANDVDEILFNSLKKAGCIAVTCGIESGSDNSLIRIKKNTTSNINKRAISILQKNGIQLKSAFCMFEPDITLEDINENCKLLNFIAEREPDNLLFFSDEEVIPYSGTQFRKELIKKGLLEVKNWYDIGEYNFINPEVKKLFQAIKELKPFTLLLQRYWVEFSISKNVKVFPFELEEEIGRIRNTLVKIPMENLLSVIDYIKKEKNLSEIICKSKNRISNILKRCKLISAKIKKIE